MLGSIAPHHIPEPPLPVLWGDCFGNREKGEMGNSGVRDRERSCVLLWQDQAWGEGWTQQRTQFVPMWCGDQGASVGQGHGEKPLLANQSHRGRAPSFSGSRQCPLTLSGYRSVMLVAPCIAVPLGLALGGPIPAELCSPQVLPMEMTSLVCADALSGGFDLWTEDLTPA